MKLIKKRILGLVISIALVLTLIPGLPARAEKIEINNIKISGITLPKGGEKPVTTGITVSNSNCIVDYVTWREANGNGGVYDQFVSGETYCIQINLTTAKDSGYIFSNPLTVTTDVENAGVETSYGSTIRSDSTRDDLEIVYIKFVASGDATKTKYKVTYDPNGGTVKYTSTMTDTNGKITKYTDASRDGYIFLGWYDSKNTRVDGSTVYTEDTTIYAKWKKIENTIDNIMIYNLPIPYPGEKPMNSEELAKKIECNNGKVKVDYATWRGIYDAAGNFVEGNTYQIQVNLITARESGNVFANPLKYTYNGGPTDTHSSYYNNVVSNIGYDDIEIVYFDYICKADGTVYLDEIDIKNITPKLGEKQVSSPKFIGKNGDTEYDDIWVDYDVMWSKKKAGATEWESMELDEVFLKDYTYLVEARVQLRGFRVNEDTKGKLEGKSANVDGGSAYESRYVAYISNEWTLNDSKEEDKPEVKEPKIVGICQIPDPYGRGGALVGLETSEPDQGEYTAEILLLDCTLLAEGKPAWIYATGKRKFPTNCIWTNFKIPYGYYWTLFRIYDKQGKLVDEQCYGFANIF